MPNNRRFSKRSPGNAPPGAGPAASGGAGWEGISHSSEDSTESVPSKRCDADFEFSFHPCASSSSPAGSARARASPPLAVSSAPTHDSACVAPRCLRRRPSSAESQNLLLALQEREAGRLSGLRRSGPARQAILGKRGRLTYCLDELVSSDHPARESVILGFSGDGQSLISYAAHTNFNIAGAEHSDYALELWACAPPHQLRRHMCAPLFNCEQGGDFGASDLLEHVPLHVTVADFRRDALLCVVGTGSVHELSQNEDQTTRRTSISVIIGADTSPKFRLATSSLTPPSVLLLHLTYLCTPPFPDVQPHRCIIAGGRRRPWGDSGAAASDLDVLPVSVLVNSGDTVRVLTVARKHGVPRHAAFGAEHYDLAARLERRGMHGELLACDDVELVQASWDAEEYLSLLLSHLSARRSAQADPDTAAQSSLVLRDYDLRIVDTLGHSHGSALSPLADGREDCVVIGIVAVVAATSDYEGKTMMLGHVLILDSCSGVVMHSMSTKLQPCHPKVLEPPSALVERFMATWRAKLDVPPLSQVRREEVEVMDNDALLRGQCVDALYNPAFPLTITPPQRRGSP